MITKVIIMTVIYRRCELYDTTPDLVEWDTSVRSTILSYVGCGGES